METAAEGMGRGEDAIRRHVQRALRELMTDNRPHTEIPTVPPVPPTSTPLAIAQIAFAMTQSLFIRAVIATVFALPATFAGYHVVLAMAQIGVPSLAWREVFACLRAG